MKKVGHNIRIIIVGTNKSQILDADEEFIVEFSKDEPLREDFEDINDLIDNAIQTSFYKGDIIRELEIDGNDFVRSLIIDTLQKNQMNAGDSVPELSSLPFLSNADPSDVYDMVFEVLSSLNDDLEEPNEY